MIQFCEQVIYISVLGTIFCVSKFSKYQSFDEHVCFGKLSFKAAVIVMGILAIMNQKLTIL